MFFTIIIIMHVITIVIFKYDLFGISIEIVLHLFAFFIDYIMGHFFL